MRHRAWAVCVGVAVMWSCGCGAVKPLPPGISFEGQRQEAREVEFLADLTWVDQHGARHVEQHVFDEIFSIIANAERFILVDMFLYNDFQGEVREETRALSAELTEALVAAKRNRPALDVVLISDPVNTVYGGIKSKHFEALESAGVDVVVTRLDKLRDSNPAYSSFWRILAWPFGVREGGFLPSPFSEERVSLLSYLALLNFKANHRKVVIADDGDGYVGLVTSANPHDGSSAHGNVALRFSGPAVADLLETEKAVVAFSDGDPPAMTIDAEHEASGVSVQVLTERKIREAILESTSTAGEGDSIDVAVFYLADYAVVQAIFRAHQRGAAVRVLLDPNKDAFGYEKGGIPNKPVAARLNRDDVPVRWCDTHGEQCHAKMMLVSYGEGNSFLLLGSANFTSRNLKNYNLETSVAVRGPSTAEVMLDASAYFERVWGNEEDRMFSVPYESYADESFFKAIRYRFMESSGMATF